MVELSSSGWSGSLARRFAVRYFEVAGFLFAGLLSFFLLLALGEGVASLVGSPLAFSLVEIVSIAGALLMLWQLFPGVMCGADWAKS